MAQSLNRRTLLILGVSAVAVAGCSTVGGMTANAVNAIKKLLGISSKKALAKLGAGGLADVIAKGSGLSEVIGGVVGGGTAGQVVAVMDRLGLMRGIERKMASAVNGVADKAAPFIVDQIGVLAVNDALAVVNGSDDAATQLLKTAISNKLADFLMPDVAKSLVNVGALSELQTALGLAGSPTNAFDLNGIASKLTALAGDGIFNAIAAEERLIRADPASTGDPEIIAIFGRKA
jgi:Protein of unknown function (DUF4197)